MTAYSKGKEEDLRSSPTRVSDMPDYSVLAGKDFGSIGISGNRDDGLDDLIQRIVRRNCHAVLQIATPHMSDIHTVIGKLSRDIAANLEARMSKVARGRRRANDSRGKGRPKDSLNVLATDILKWTENHPLPMDDDSRYSDDSQHSDDSDATRLEADYISPLFEAFLLFVAHHVQEHLTKRNATRLLRSENCRLIFPIANKDVEAEDTDTDTSSTDYIDSTAYVDPADFANAECGMFPIGSIVERQVAPAPHLVVADAEMVRHKDDYSEAELRLATKTKAMFFNQHNRRFAWGLAVCSRNIYAYVFGADDIWASTEMNMSSAKGRQAFISLLVDWSLCSVDRLGFDPTIRYEIDHTSGDPYLAIDVVEMVESTGKMKSHTYYSQQCVGAVDRLTGRHARYFTASARRDSMVKPTFLIKDVWATSGSGSAGDTRESTFLNVLHAKFDESSEFSGRFSRLVRTVPVHISHGNTFVADSTITAFAGLPDVSHVRQHRRTVVKWAGQMVSAADNPSQVVVAVADAMAALNAAYVKGKILHGNISDRAILIQETADGIKGVLADFDYASYAGDSAIETPELMISQSIRSLEDAEAIRTPLDDGESLLYLVCWLGTFGINRVERMAYAADYTARCREGRRPRLPILWWSQGDANDVADRKRSNLSTPRDFEEDILSHMRCGPLRRLAADIYRALFLHPGCSGTKPGSYLEPKSHHVAPTPGGERDPLALRNSFVDAMIWNLLQVSKQLHTGYLNKVKLGEHSDTQPTQATQLPEGELDGMMYMWGPQAKVEFQPLDMACFIVAATGQECSETFVKTIGRAYGSDIAAGS
ncbi:hypothetical protein H4S07_000663 [Coemansia furcata]|uniref:Uncharacterized protein n=1 Tax=Coemansia furcata TaxID=417177 RepID=A0ACC1LQV6_9FUNG|nr:hypothetical protein H4S07_000663 [Coemansia furcata]